MHRLWEQQDGQAVMEYLMAIAAVAVVMVMVIEGTHGTVEKLIGRIGALLATGTP